MATGLDDRDPGWPRVWFALLPRMAMKRATNPGALWIMRLVFTAFTSSVILVGVVVLVIGGRDGEGTTRPGVAAAVVICVGVAGLLGSSWMVGRFVDRVDEHNVVTEYRSMFLGRVAFSEAAALIGFVGFILSNEQNVYFIGLVLTLALFRLLVPTAAGLRQLDERLKRDRPGISVIEALYSEAGNQR